MKALKIALTGANSKLSAQLARTLSTLYRIPYLVPPMLMPLEFCLDMRKPEKASALIRQRFDDSMEFWKGSTVEQFVTDVHPINIGARYLKVPEHS